MNAERDFSPRELIEQAAVFEREHDPEGAVARAKLAVHRAHGDMLDEAMLALDRTVRTEHEWRAAVVRRGQLHDERERRAAGVDLPVGMEAAAGELVRERDAEAQARPSPIGRVARWAGLSPAHG